MSQQQLDHAYALIKEGRNDEAVTLLEPLIRANRDNEDAWWLYANATGDSEARRNALNNILRIGTNPAREEQVRQMLADLISADAPRALPVSQRSPAQQQQSGKSNRAKIALGVVTIFGLCACAMCFWLISSVGNLLYAPSSYDGRGTIAAGETVSGTIDTQGDWDGYLYQGQAGERLVISARSARDGIAPFVFLYNSDDEFIWLSNETSPAVNRLRTELPVDDTYVIIVRTFMGQGAGDYDLSITAGE